MSLSDWTGPDVYDDICQESCTTIIVTWKDADCLRRQHLQEKEHECAVDRHVKVLF